MLFNTYLAVAATAALVSASPVKPRAQPAAYPIRKVSTFTSIKNIVAKDKAKVRAMNTGRTKGTLNALGGPATNDQISYTAAVTIGSKTYSLVVDTGSSNTWCGARDPYEKSKTSKSTNGTVSVQYGSGYFDGNEYTDKVTFGGLTVPAQSIGAANVSSGFESFDGILGFGPIELTEGTVSNADKVPTFMDNLHYQGSIPTHVLGVYFKPVSGDDLNDPNGQLTLGGTDPNKYTGALTYFPKLASGDAANYWGIAVSEITYGSESLADSATGVVDTGTTLIFLPSDAFNRFLDQTGGDIDTESGLPYFAQKPAQNISITFDSTVYDLTPDQYLVPSAEYSYFGLEPSNYYAWINDGGNSGINAIIGQKFLENYYSVYDASNGRIGFATRA